jgi:hypothetical protein
VPFLFLLKPGNQGGRIMVSRVNATGIYLTASSVESWAQTAFERVTFQDVSIEYVGAGHALNHPVKAPGVDPRPLPAWGFYVRGVKDLRLENVRLTLAREAAGPVILAENVGKLTFDGLRFPRTEAAGVPLVLTTVDNLQVHDGNWPTVQPRATGLEVLSSGKPITAGQPFSVKAKVANGPVAGLAKVELEIAGRRWTNWLWLQANEERETTFAAVTVSAAGQYEGVVGTVKEKLLVKQ